MAEYIERQAAIDALTERNLVVHMDSVYDGLVASCHRSAQRIIANIPAADVRPVILCKDCTALRDDIGYCMYWGEYVNDSGYCSYGKNREES